MRSVLKKLYLHIGAHKTATTYLQNLFCVNADQLAQKGLLYPRAGQAFEAHHLLPWALNEDSAELEDIPVWQEVFAEIDRSECDTVLLSSEDFEWSRHIARLRPLGKRYDVRIVFFLRSPETYLESYYNQLVKDFETREARTLEQYISESSLFFLDPRRILNKWADVFGKKAINLQLFDRETRKIGVERVLLDTLGCKAKFDFEPPQLSVLHKTSLAPDALEYLRLCNPHFTHKKGHFQYVMKLAERVAKHPGAFETTRAGLLSLPAKRTILGRFSNQNKAVAKMYLGQDKNPFPVESATSHRDFDTRLAIAGPNLVAKVAALLSH